MAQQINYRGAVYQRVGHTNAEVIEMVDKMFAEMEARLKSMSAQLERVKTQTNEIVRSPDHSESDDMDIKIVMSRLAGGFKQNVLNAQQALEIAEKISKR